MEWVLWLYHNWSARSGRWGICMSKMYLCKNLLAGLGHKQCGCWPWWVIQPICCWTLSHSTFVMASKYQRMSVHHFDLKTTRQRFAEILLGHNCQLWWVLGLSDRFWTDAWGKHTRARLHGAWTHRRMGHTSFSESELVFFFYVM